MSLFHARAEASARLGRFPRATRTREPEEAAGATVMLMRWEGVTEDQYEQAASESAGTARSPTVRSLMSRGFSDGGLNVTDRWESAEAFWGFNDQRLAPAVQRDWDVAL